MKTLKTWLIVVLVIVYIIIAEWIKSHYEVAVALKLLIGMSFLIGLVMFLYLESDTIKKGVGTQKWGIWRIRFRRIDFLISSVTAALLFLFTVVSPGKHHYCGDGVIDKNWECQSEVMEVASVVAPLFLLSTLLYILISTFIRIKWGKWTVTVKNKEELVAEIKKQVGFGRLGKNWKANLNHIDTSLIEDMSGLFAAKTDTTEGYGLEKFNGLIDKWDVSNVRDMSNAFYRCYSFKQQLESWNVGSVTNMKGMFLESGVTFPPTWYDKNKWER